MAGAEGEPPTYKFEQLADQMNEVEETAADEKNAARTDQYAEQVRPCMVASRS